MFPTFGDPPPPLILLTRQQARALAAVAISTNRREAAALLGRSTHTLENHLGAAFDRLHASSLSEALWRVGWTLPPLALLELPVREPDTLIFIGGVA
jgi:DNA-binding CsgD family transcriptional regulator